MRTNEEIIDLILNVAHTDPLIQTIGMQGSRSKDNHVDKYSDFDLVFIVDDLQPYMDDKHWIDRFGDILILQTPDDWFDHPFEPHTMHKFTWLMQFRDGTRIDLTVIQSDEESLPTLQMKVIFDRTGILSSILQTETFPFTYPAEKEFLDTVNEFWWMTLYVTKGICRAETTYAKASFDILLAMTNRMLEWQIQMQHDGQANVGKYMRHLQDYLTVETFNIYANCFPTLQRDDLEVKLIHIIDFFLETSSAVATMSGYQKGSENTDQIKTMIRAQIEASKIA